MSDLAYHIATEHKLRFHEPPLTTTCSLPTCGVAKVERVRDWLDHRGVDVSDRDGAYMDGYRAAQRHAVTDAAELRAALDGAES